MAHNRLPPDQPEDEPESIGPGYYILDDRGRPVRVYDVLEFAHWFETADRVLKKDYMGEIDVSTVFLGLNHRYGSGPPLLWETMIFGGEHDQYCYRYASRAEALLGHEKAVQLVKEAQANKADGESVSQWLARHHPSPN